MDLNERINQIEIYSIDDLINQHEAAGYHWFSKENKAFFKSRVASHIVFGPRYVYFISSEQCGDNPRAYTIRQFDPNNSEISKHSEFQGYLTMAAAKRDMKKLSL